MTLKVTTTLGHDIATIVDAWKPSGIHQVTFDAHNLATGLYFYTLKAENFVVTRKLLLLR